MKHHPHGDKIGSYTLLQGLEEGLVLPDLETSEWDRAYQMLHLIIDTRRLGSYCFLLFF